MDALPLGMLSSNTHEVTHVSEAKDYFVEKNGVRYAGTHLIIDGGWTAE